MKCYPSLYGLLNHKMDRRISYSAVYTPLEILINSKDTIYALGRLRNNATPKIPNSIYSKENSDSETGTDVEDDDILSRENSVTWNRD